MHSTFLCLPKEQLWSLLCDYTHTHMFLSWYDAWKQQLLNTLQHVLHCLYMYPHNSINGSFCLVTCVSESVMKWSILQHVTKNNFMLLQNQKSIRLQKTQQWGIICLVKSFCPYNSYSEFLYIIFTPDNNNVLYDSMTVTINNKDTFLNTSMCAGLIQAMAPNYTTVFYVRWGSYKDQHCNRHLHKQDIWNYFATSINCSNT